MLWTRNPVIAENTRLLLRLITTGFLLNTTLIMPFTLQLANRWTSLSFYKNVVAIIILIPLLFFLIPDLGAVAGAVTWVLLMAGCVLFEIPLMHLRLMRREMWRWYIVDVGLPATCCIIVGVMLKIVFGDNATTMKRLTALAITGGSMFLVCALALPFSRSYFGREN